MFDESFFVLVATIVTIIVVFKPVSKAVLGALDDYRRKVSADLDYAQNLHLEGRELIASLNAKRQEIKKRAKAIVEQANESCKQQYEQALVVFQRTSDTKRRLLQDRLNRFESQCTLDVKEDIARQVYDKAQVILAATGGNHNQLVEELIQTIPQSFKK